MFVGTYRKSDLQIALHEDIHPKISRCEMQYSRLPADPEACEQRLWKYRHNIWPALGLKSNSISIKSTKQSIMQQFPLVAQPRMTNQLILPGGVSEVIGDKPRPFRRRPTLL